MDIKKGDIFYADLEQNDYCVQNGIRPVVVISNNVGNEYGTTIIVAPLTSKIKRTDLPIHTILTRDEENGLELNSVVLLEQIKTIDKRKLFSKMGSICEKDLENINKCLRISLGL